MPRRRCRATSRKCQTKRSWYVPPRFVQGVCIEDLILCYNQDLRRTKQVLQKPNSLTFYLVTAEFKEGAPPTAAAVGERTLALRAASAAELNAWASVLVSFVGCVSAEGLLTHKTIPIPAPMVRGLVASLDYLLAHGSVFDGTLFFFFCLFFFSYFESALTSIID
jgi:hypothetical protein